MCGFLGFCCCFATQPAEYFVRSFRVCSVRCYVFYNIHKYGFRVLGNGQHALKAAERRPAPHIQTLLECMCDLPWSTSFPWVFGTLKTTLRE